MLFFFHSCVGYNFNLLTFYSSPIECHQDSFFKELYYHFSISYRLAHKFYTILEKQWRLKNFPYDFKILFFFDQFMCEFYRCLRTYVLTVTNHSLVYENFLDIIFFYIFHILEMNGKILLMYALNVLTEHCVGSTFNLD